MRRERDEPVEGGRKRLPKVVFTLGWISFFTDIASEMSYQILPLFIMTIAGGSTMTLGLIEGVADGLVNIMKAAAGRQSDRIGRRVPFIRLGYALGAAGKPILAVATTWPIALIGRAVDRFGKGVRSTARDAYLADVIEEGERGRAFGLHRLMDTSGALLGGIAAMALLHLMPGEYRTVFAIATIPGIAAVALTFLIKEPTERMKAEARRGSAGDAEAKVVEAEPAERPLPADGTGKMRMREWPAAYWRSLALLVVFGFAASSDTFLLLRAKDVGVKAELVPLGYTIYNLVYALAAYPAGVLSDRIGRWSVIRAGWVIYAVVYAGFAYVSTETTALVWPLFAVYGMFAALTEGVTKALLADHAPADQRGSAIGFASMCLGFTTIAASLLAGWMWEKYGGAAPFWFGSAMAGLAVALAPILMPKAKKS